MGCGASNGISMTDKDERICDLTTQDGGVTEVHIRQIGKLGCKDLILEKNNLQVLPAGIGSIKTLTKLSFAENSLQELPDELIQIAGTLTILDARCNLPRFRKW
mmetsp:Transcript_16187/g.43938  ORF Transcript_16187/g.43938 Transcript_16187/m.43938 type:complete len:104 (-) Transcript_16187:1081-1392(-)